MPRTFILIELYDSKIDFRISTFRDEGFHVELGDFRSGIKAWATFGSLEKACEWLGEAAIKHFPDSKFARDHYATIGTMLTPSAEPIHRRIVDPQMLQVADHRYRFS
jgi:hypothetical protein